MNMPTQKCERRSKRVALECAVGFQLSKTDGGQATITDVNLGGVSLELADAVQEGQHILLRVPSPGQSEPIIELKGRVAWYRPVQNGYRVGVQVYHDSHAAKVSLCALMCDALKKQAAVAGLRDRHFRYVEWKLTAMIERQANDTIQVGKPKKSLRPTAGRILALGY